VSWTHFIPEEPEGFEIQLSLYILYGLMQLEEFLDKHARFHDLYPEV